MIEQQFNLTIFTFILNSFLLMYNICILYLYPKPIHEFEFFKVYCIIQVVTGISFVFFQSFLMDSNNGCLMNNKNERLVIGFSSVYLTTMICFFLLSSALDGISIWIDFFSREERSYVLAQGSLAIAITLCLIVSLDIGVRLLRNVHRSWKINKIRKLIKNYGSTSTLVPTPGSEQEPEIRCNICMDEENNDRIIDLPNCNHQICQECYGKLVKQGEWECPFCRTSIIYEA